MKYKIIGDSCFDWTEKEKADPHFAVVPLTLQVGDYHVVDDASFDQKLFLQKVRECPTAPQTACPSPELYKQAYECDADNIFVITLSSKLSGSYNSALVAKHLYEEEHGFTKNIHVVDSESASSGELNIGLTIRDLCEQDLPFEEIVRRAEEYRDSMVTWFVLEQLDHLRKNGRLTGLTAMLVTALNIKPVMSADHGEIIKISQDRGIDRALRKMVKLALEKAGDTAGKRLIISHVNNLARAEFVKNLAEKAARFREVIITDTQGVATVYAEDGGIIMTL